MLDEMLQQNTSKFAIFLEYENPLSFFRFSFCATLFFPLMNALVLTSEEKIAWNEKQKNLYVFSYSKNMANFEVFH